MTTAATTTKGDDAGVAAAANDTGRLPRTAVPRHYALHYSSIDLIRHTFAGNVAIDVDIPEDGDGGGALLDDDDEEGDDVIVLHALEVLVDSATLTSAQTHAAADGTAGSTTAAPTPAVEVEAFEFRYRKRDETVTLVFPPGTLTPGDSYVLAASFTGVLNSDMHGLYRSTYQSLLTGKELTIACTQFEATDARRAFPCFDEPALKATFQLSVAIDVDGERPGLDVLSNTAAEEVTTTTTAVGPHEKLRRTYKFATTPLMSTYLLALLVGEFDRIASTSPKSGVVTSVYTVPGRSSEGRFCLEVASKALDLYADTFGVPYPLGKSDLVAVPDFAAGAMENWGLVTYREAKILVRPGSTSETTRRGIARTVCHELAHMWYGNLVTMDFWTQLWLKEGVARYMEFVGIDALFPEWDAWTEFVQSVYGLALGLDSMASSHPVEVEVKHSDEIKEIFDAISYAKGASIVRMVASYVGADNFFKGMKLYIQRNKYGNTVTRQFWGALEEASGLPVVELALPWTMHTGFPLVVLPEEGSGEQGITTPRFLASGPPASTADGSSADGDDDEGGQWPVPVTAVVEGTDGTQGPWVLNGPAGDDSSELLAKILQWTAAGKWFKLNVSQSGFYRVAYTEAQWAKLADVVSPLGPLSKADRLGLLSDSFAAGRAGYSSIVSSLKLAKRFGGKEFASADEFAVFQELSDNLASLASLYRSRPFVGAFRGYLRDVYANLMAEIGWDAKEGESSRAGTLRATAIRMLSAAGDAEVGAEALRRFKLCVQNPEGSAIPGDLQSTVFRVAMKADERYVFDELLRMYEASSFPEERTNCLSALGCVADPRRHAALLEYVLLSGKVKQQDIAYPLGSLAQTTDAGSRACWDTLKSRFDELRRKFGSGGPMWGAVVGLSCRGLSSRQEADDVEAFFEDPRHPVGSAKKRLAQALEAVRNKAARLDRDCGPVAKFLTELDYM